MGGARGGPQGRVCCDQWDIVAAPATGRGPRGGSGPLAAPPRVNTGGLGGGGSSSYSRGPSRGRGSGNPCWGSSGAGRGVGSTLPLTLGSRRSGPVANAPAAGAAVGPEGPPPGGCLASAPETARWPPAPRPRQSSLQGPGPIQHRDPAEQTLRPHGTRGRAQSPAHPPPSGTFLLPTTPLTGCPVTPGRGWRRH